MKIYVTRVHHFMFETAEENQLPKLEAIKSVNLTKKLTKSCLS